MARWADVLYACDEKWWQVKYSHDFPGLRVIGKGAHPGCHEIGVIPKDKMQYHGDHLGGGGNSGFQAMNLATLWGAKKLILTGFDYQDAGNHWFGRHPATLAQANPGTVTRWLSCMRGEAPRLKQRGVTVINATRETAIDCFPRMSVGQALAHVG